MLFRTTSVWEIAIIAAVVIIPIVVARIFGQKKSKRRQREITKLQPGVDDIPEEFSGWNWGAFLLGWIWGLGNRVYISLLSLIPVFGIFWLFVLGVRGSEWAWQHGNWDSAAHFQRVQRRWSCWAIGIALLLICLALGRYIIALFLVR